ncbi:MAG: alpha/beta fold hydrolase [Bacteroidetes bacterium]|nr:alpha/beta fold hydrolase [Bacteroidota bacterium]
MIYRIAIFLFSLLRLTSTTAQKKDEALIPHKMNEYEIIKTESHTSGLKIALTHKEPAVLSNDYAVLFLHGSSFPSALAFGFRMSNYSWMDNLAENGYDVYALDFLGYGNADRYPEMETNLSGKPVGRALDVYQDVDKAIDLIIKRTGKPKVYLIGHSWGGSVAALYATKFPDKVAKLVLFAAITQRQDTSSIERIDRSYELLTPEQRITSMKNLTPEEKVCQLEPEVFKTWGDVWLRSDTLATKFKSSGIRFPAGPSQDVEDMLHNKPYYNPGEIKSSTLVIRGEWDGYPDNSDDEKLFAGLVNSRHKKYVVIEKGTHVVHLEKSRYQLYDEVLHFLKYGTKFTETNRHAIAVIFEVIPSEGQKAEYLNIALNLKPELEKIKGFISIERFQSIYQPEKILSLSFWENEQAIQEWRNVEMHRNAQLKGREYIFKDYQLRIAQVVRDYGMFDRKEAPVDSKTFHKVQRK